MDGRFGRLAARAAEQHNVVSTADFDEMSISRDLRLKWIKVGALEVLGTHTFGFTSAPRTWQQSLMVGLLDLGPGSLVAGRSGAALHRLDGFKPGPVELLVPRHMRRRTTIGRVASTVRPITSLDSCRVDGLRVLRPERLILEAPLFDFTSDEIEDAIDSSIRLRLTSEGRLRQRIASDRSLGVNGGRMLLDALVDAGGESKLERAFLRILRLAGLPRPQLQRSHRNGLRLIARVDTQYGEDLIIEVEGHRTHSSRHQRQSDEQRRTELTLLGKRTIVFTYDDVMARPDWTLGVVEAALAQNVA